MSGHKPTPEQARIIDGFATGQNLVIEAGAGTGKTSTLKMLAAGDAARRRGVYIAYNRAIADDAARGFPSTVNCRTAHGLAYGAVGSRFRHRLNAPRQRAIDTARILRINDPIRLADDKAPLAPQQLARLTMETIQRYCYSRDERIQRRHLPLVNGIDEEPVRAELARYLVPIAQRAWDDDLTQLHGTLRFTHDTYLKLWILSRPQLPGDYVLLDEAQDANPAVAALVEDQDAQRILVGDRSQAIYGWRGATDAMRTFQGLRFQLSQSFRFGPAVAAEANKWLTVLKAPLRLSGYDQIASIVGAVAEPDAILCRSNAGAMARVIEAFDTGRAVALVGGGTDIQRMARAALDLQAGRPTDHPELFAFSTWTEVEEYVCQDKDGSDLKVFVNLVNRYGAAEVIRACDGLVAEEYADVVVSTAHKAKGREWATVRIASDFQEPKPDDDGVITPQREEAMLAYVAVTRARKLLDPDGLSWIDRVVPAGSEYRPDPLARAQACAAIAPDYVRPAVQLVDDGDEWPAPADDVDPADEEKPGGPAPTNPVDDLAEELYGRLIERAPERAGWLSRYCVRCLAEHTRCECVLGPDRRWTPHGDPAALARFVQARLDAPLAGTGARIGATVQAAQLALEAMK